MKKILVCVIGLSLFPLFGVDRSGHASGTHAKILFEEKCSMCHSIERPKSQTKTRKDWETTVMRMRNVHDGPITSEEAQMIIEYLAEHYGK